MLMLLILTPYFTSSFLDLRQERENKENYQKLLEEQRAQKEAEEKIYLMGKFDPAQRDDFVLVPEQYAIDGNKMYLRKEALGSFLRMRNAAEKDGIELLFIKKIFGTTSGQAIRLLMAKIYQKAFRTDKRDLKKYWNIALCPAHPDIIGARI